MGNTIAQPLKAFDLEHELYRIRSDYDNEKYALERQAADRVLKLYRRMVDEYDVGGHDIRLWAVMGGCGITIDGVPMKSTLAEGNWAGLDPRLYDMLIEIECSMEFWFMKFLEGKVLKGQS